MKVKDIIDHVFVTSDHHFLSWLTCKWDFMKTFTSLQEQELVKKWNEVVKEDDIVLYAGDFIDADDKEDLVDVKNELNGKIILVKGNHDILPDEVYKDVFVDVYSQLDLEDIKVSIVHDSFEDTRPGWRRIYGHFHRGWSPFSMNVTKDNYCCCVSRNNGYPVKLKDAIEMMDNVNS